ncbi:unnamed protein product [Prorocentrum cordatum]|uniref:Ion transport domain-containing protein n=1 Tax=Prorocentrum cordatum TaxID=2364126 RepID=A0ABN9XJP4_9DINO|nr:unnamed protein product [Polarella glacialis]
MNLVDLISIIPWWLEFVIETSGFKLGFLRSARLIRLVRLMKVGGLGRKFEIMCEVFARSWGSIAAIAVTLCVLSLSQRGLGPLPRRSPRRRISTTTSGSTTGSG